MLVMKADELSFTVLVKNSTLVRRHKRYYHCERDFLSIYYSM